MFTGVRAFNPHLNGAGIAVVLTIKVSPFCNIRPGAELIDSIRCVFAAPVYA